MIGRMATIKPNDNISDIWWNKVKTISSNALKVGALSPIQTKLEIIYEHKVEVI
jgi:hypothetical protein